jgi:L-asparagine transporter-like permease
MDATSEPSIQEKSRDLAASGASSQIRDAETPKLKRALGLWMTTALVLGNVIGSGVFLLPASLASEAGPVAKIAWLVTGLGS